MRKNGEKLEEGELEYYEPEIIHHHQHHHLSVKPPPPPPSAFNPPSLRLVVHHSLSQPSKNLLPADQTLAILKGTTSIGRDRSYNPRIRLKSLEVSKTHATLFFDEIQQDWCVCDNASTHGTFVRNLGGQWERLSEKGVASLPRILKHLDGLKVANQRFIVHLHSAPPWSCYECSVSEDSKNLVHLMASLPPGVASTLSNPAIMNESRSKEQKVVDHKKNMQTLRADLLSKPTQPMPRIAAFDAAVASPAIAMPEAPLATNHASLYVDRAKLRRSLYPSSYGLSDAQPPSDETNSLQTASRNPQKLGRVEPNYGMGSSLYARMASFPSSPPQDNDEYAHISKKIRSERCMGQVIDVVTTSVKGAGVGSDMIRGVETYNIRGSDGDWKDKGKERRWRESVARGSG